MKVTHITSHIDLGLKPIPGQWRLNCPGVALEGFQSAQNGKELAHCRAGLEES